MTHKSLYEIIFTLENSSNCLEIVNEDINLSIKYSDLYRLIMHNTGQYLKHGVSKNDCVLIAMESSLEKIVSFLSLVVIGAIPLSIKPGNYVDKSYIEYIDSIVSRHNVNYCIDDALKSDTIFSLPVNCSLGEVNDECESINRKPNLGNDIAFVQFSSGSTSDPKPVTISNSALMHNLQAIVKYDKREKSNLFMNVLPLCHDMGLVGGFLSSLYTGNSLLLIDTGKFLRNPLKYLKYSYQLHASITAMPDFILKYLTKYIGLYRGKKDIPKIFSNYTSIYCGAESIRRLTINGFLSIAIELGLNTKSLIFCYGMAEATLLVSAHRFSSFDLSFNKCGLHQSACVGEVINGLQVKIGSIDSSEEIMLKGESLFSGYELNKFGPMKNWFATGDLGYIKNNKLYITGRSKDMITVNGENYYSIDIENYLLETYSIKESLVIPTGDSYDVVIIPGKATFDKYNIKEGLSNAFGLMPCNIYFVKPANIIRTTSGKPIKTKTISNIKANDIERISV